ncbi:hypothetical protein ES707_16347 [subsurface metagenome]
MKKLLLIIPLALLIVTAIPLTLVCSCQQTSPGYPYQGGHMGPGGPYESGEQRISMEQAINIAEDYLHDRGGSDLKVTEIMEFEYNFYVIFAETNTGIHAFESLIDPYTGDMYPEPGPNMMWNSKYGMMSGMMWRNQIQSGEMTVTEEEAERYAQEFIDGYLPGAQMEEPDRFYGYYTLHVLKDGQIYGMLSVNGYTGQVWYHSWHGRFLGMEEFVEH